MGGQHQQTLPQVQVLLLPPMSGRHELRPASPMDPVRFAEEKGAWRSRSRCGVVPCEAGVGLLDRRVLPGLAPPGPHGRVWLDGGTVRSEAPASDTPPPPTGSVRGKAPNPPPSGPWRSPSPRGIVVETGRASDVRCSPRIPDMAVDPHEGPRESPTDNVGQGEMFGVT